MVDSIKAIHRRQKTDHPYSEYNALNYTQMGDYRLGKHLGAGSYASVK